MNVKEALAELRKEENKRKFEQSVDLVINLKGVDMRKDNVNVVLNIPHKIKDKKVTAAIKHGIKQVHKKSKTVTVLTSLMIWFFAYGLIGLGMQITAAAIMQAGGAPLVMGVISGTLKAVLSLIVVLLLIKDMV